MSKADTRLSRVTWVGNLYQKFEAVCQEVDDIVSHEHIKKLENHVQLVGDNVMKFCSNVKDMMPSSFGVPVKHVAQSVNSFESNFELKDGDGDCPSVANINQFPQQMDVIDSSTSWPSCIQISDDLHFEDNHENPSFKEPSSLSSGLQLGESDSFLINQDYDSHSAEEKKSSDISEVICSDSYFTDQSFDSFTEEKQSPFDASELTCHGSSLIAEKSDSFTKIEEESLSNIPELTFPDEDPCELSTSSMLHNQLSIDVSPSACKDSSESEFHLKEETVQDTVDEYSSGHDFLCKDEMVNDCIHENSAGSEFHLKEEVLCDKFHEFGLGSQVCLKEETVYDDSIHKYRRGSEFQVKEDIVHDSLSKSCFGVSIDNVPYSLLASSVASSDSETSTVRLTSSINSPLLDFSDHRETEFHCTEGHTFSNMVVGIESASTSSDAPQSSEPYPCVLSPNENIRDMDSSLLPSSSLLAFTGVPIISHSDNGRLKLDYVKQPVKLELDGSCVFVKNDRKHIASSEVERYLLRKKKIKNPFSSRKKLEKEYKQLSIWYCDINEELDEVLGEKMAPSSHNKRLSAQDLHESEWELL